MNDYGHENYALQGLRVLELSDEKGQLCGKLMADLGADVVKVEPPGGSTTRGVGPFFEDRPDVNRSLYFWHYNTSKRGITLDLTHESGAELFRKLVRETDVIIESGKPGFMGQCGLSYQSIAGFRPEIIYCSITPFGQRGPWANYKGSDLVLMATGGEMGVCGYDKGFDMAETPIAPGGGNAWHVGDNYAFVSVLLALNGLFRRGVGEYIDVAVHDALAVCTEGAFPDFVITGKDRLRQTGRHANQNPSPQNQFRCKDGKYVNCFMGRLRLDEWLSLLEWFEEDDLAGELKDDKYLDPDVLRPAMPLVFETIGKLCANRTSEEMFHGGQERKFAWTIVRAPSELVGDPHLEARGFFVDVEHPELGKRFAYPGPPYQFQRTPWKISRRAPLLGEHNVEIYHRELDIPLEELNVLSQTGII